jgi:hypothetical protein
MLNIQTHLSFSWVYGASIVLADPRIGAWGGSGPVEAAGVLSFGCAIVGYA